MAEKAYQRRAFELYLALGPGRSVETLNRALAGDPGRYGFRRAPSLRSLYAWSARFSWQERLADLEAQALEAAGEAWVEAIRVMNERQAKMALAIQQKGVQALSGIDPSSVGFPDAVRAIVEGARLERLARGEATERQDMQGDMTHEHRLRPFSDEELLRLLGAVEGRAEGVEPPASE
jgi:hypothetical protein